MTLSTLPAHAGDGLRIYSQFEQTKQEIQSDSNYIDEVIQTTGSKKLAGRKLISQGWDALLMRDIEKALKRFNQAWLLDNNNPNVFWGYGAILNSQEAFSEAIKMASRALTLAPNNPEIMADLAMSYVNLGSSMLRAGRPGKEEIQHANRLYSKAHALTNLPPRHTYYWALALYYNDQYKLSLVKLNSLTELGMVVPQDLLNDINSRLN